MNRIHKNIKYIFFFILSLNMILFLQSCKIGEDYQREEQNTPTSFKNDFHKDSSITNLPWWELFKDTVLNDLIRTALIENKNIQIAVARMEESLLYLDISKADYYPSINYGVIGSSGVNSESSSFSNSISPGINVSYTVDLWQKIKTLNEIDLQNYYASEEAYKSLNISLVSTVAKSYISLRDLDNRLIIAEKTAKNFQDNQDVMQARFNAGLINEVDLTQSKIQLSEAKTAIEVFIRSRNHIENGINVLLGSTPKEIPRGLTLFDQLGTPNVPVRLPSELLDRRPDILEAERKLHAQTLRIGVAETLKYPSLTLSLDMGAQLLNPTLVFGNLTGQLLGPLFNAGKLQKNVEVEEVRTQQLLYIYQDSFLNALREVEDALIAVSTYKREYFLRNEQMEMATKAAHLSWVRYDGGLTSYLEVLNLQSSQFNAELKASEAFKKEISSVVDLYEALGGGWYIDINQTLNNK